MKATILLADSVQQEPGSAKVHALGIGWTTTSTPTPPAGIIVLLRIPWDQTNRRHTLTLTLVDSDGQPVMLGQTPDGQSAPLQISQQFEVGRPPGIPQGMDLDHNLSLNLGPGMPLAANQIYEWRLEIDGHHDEVWSAKFFVRPGQETFVVGPQ